ncbi:hypothetical protein [Candidatus Oscillochloris fontis]|uniref:hypothetical protein n=1 Tax=Candidatus Oscillochloris fontis TaxID=2496868 RepID=UPI00101D56C2|nr:hypothetical protein [Candidatus Oscillochloris fontis]
MAKNANAILKTLGVGIALIQLVDIFIHAATDQLEIIRVISNLVILLWLAVIMLNWYKIKFLQISISSIGLYVILNFIFLAKEGLTNPEQGGNLRTMLLLLAFLTVTLSGLMSYMYNRTLA